MNILILILVTDDDEDIVTLPIIMAIHDGQRNSVTPIQFHEMPSCHRASSVIIRKLRPRTNLPNTTKLAQSNLNQSVPVIKTENRKRFAQNIKLEKMIKTEKLYNLQDARADMQKYITNLDQKLNAARQQYIAFSKENKRRCVLNF